MVVALVAINDADIWLAISQAFALALMKSESSNNRHGNSIYELYGKFNSALEVRW